MGEGTSVARAVSATAARTRRFTRKSYRTAREPVHDHFRPAGDFVARQAQPIDRREQVATRGKLRKPRRKNDDDVGAALGDVPEHARLTHATHRPNFGRHSAYETL